jgi:aspartyl-tRNA(Asn)/glutamyl-tRNA(Gln) amidotransferase subunit C
VISNSYFCFMQVTDALIDKLATLSKLNFNAEEKIAIRSDLQRMVSFVEKLQEVNTEGVEPLLHMVNKVNVWREDVPSGDISRETALKNAPVHDEEFFKVPKIIRK